MIINPNEMFEKLFSKQVKYEQQSYYRLSKVKFLRLLIEVAKYRETFYFMKTTVYKIGRVSKSSTEEKFCFEISQMKFLQRFIEKKKKKYCFVMRNC